MLCILFSTILSSNVARGNMITIFDEASRCTRLRVTTENNFLFVLVSFSRGWESDSDFHQASLKRQTRWDSARSCKMVSVSPSKFLVEDPVVLENSWHFSAPARWRLRSDGRFSVLMTWLYKVLGLVKQVAIKHMHAVGTVGPLQLAVHVAQNRLLESKCGPGTRQTKDIHNFKW